MITGLLYVNFRQDINVIKMDLNLFPRSQSKIVCLMFYGESTEQSYCLQAFLGVNLLSYGTLYSVNLSRIRWISKICISFLGNVLFQYCIKTSVKYLIS